MKKATLPILVMILFMHTALTMNIPLYSPEDDHAFARARCLKNKTSQWLLQHATISPYTSHQFPSASTIICFSPSGRHFAFATIDGTVCLCDLDNFSYQPYTTQYPYNTFLLSFSPDESMLNVLPCPTESLTVHINPDGENHQTHDPLPWVFPSPKGRYKLFPSENALHVFRWFQASPLYEINSNDQIVSFQFSQAEEYIAYGENNHNIRIFNLSLGQEKHVLNGHASLPTNICFSSDDYYLAVGYQDGTICLWHTISGILLQKLYQQEGEVWALCFSPDNNYLGSGLSDGTVRVWNIQPLEEIKQFIHNDITLQQVLALEEIKNTAQDAMIDYTDLDTANMPDFIKNLL